MAPGGGVCKEVFESHTAFADYDVSTANLKPRSSPFREAASSGSVKFGLPSTSSVHELLECPVCMDLMHPPIHQCPNGHTLCSNCNTRVLYCCPNLSP